MKYFNLFISKLIHKIWMIPCQATSVCGTNATFKGWAKQAKTEEWAHHPAFGRVGGGKPGWEQWRWLTSLWGEESIFGSWMEHSCGEKIIDRMVWVGRDHYKSSRPCNDQGNLQLDQVAQAHVQSDFKCFPGHTEKGVVGIRCSVP